MSKNINANEIANENNSALVKNPINFADFVELINDKNADNKYNDKGRKLTTKESTFVIDEGAYKGTITGAFWYKTAEERDRVMLVIQLEDGT